MERELITKHTELRNAYFQLEKKNAELQAMQETLVQSGKMAALGELAAGIAHELNQPLQGIRGYAQELQESCSRRSKKVRAPTKPMRAFARSSRTSIRWRRSSSTCGRSSASPTRSTRWSTCTCSIEEALKMLSRQFAMRGITVERDYGKDVPQVYANPLQLEQVIINLATNARDAIEATGRGKGTMSIMTRKAGKFVEVLFRETAVA